MIKDKNVRSKEEINNILKSAELTELLVRLISFFILSGICGYIGYSFCLDNNYDVPKGIVFGILFPMGIALLKEANFGSKFTYVVYTIIYFVLLDYIPTYIGIVLLFIIILLFVAVFVSVLKKDRSEEVDRIYRQEHCNEVKISENYKQLKDQDKDIDFNFLDEVYSCERCFKRISQEEYELYDDMCEECFEETHYDFDGNPREDYWNY